MRITQTSVPFAVLIVALTTLGLFVTPTSSPVLVYLNSVLVVILVFSDARRALEQEGEFRKWRGNGHSARSGAKSKLTLSIHSIRCLENRVRLSYALIGGILFLEWSVRLWLYPFPALSWSEWLQRANFGVIPGWVVIGVTSFVYGSFLMILML